MTTIEELQKQIAELKEEVAELKEEINKPVGGYGTFGKEYEVNNTPKSNLRKTPILTPLSESLEKLDKLIKQ